jgi:imidazolonepropionase-like amidohydrolase
MLLDGYGGVPVHHAAILLAGNRIVAAGPASEIVIPPGTPVIDTRGETMMPGMALQRRCRYKGRRCVP